MADDKKLTPEQQEMIASLTEEEKNQITALLTPEGKIDEEKLQSVSGGLSPKLKAVIGLAAGGAVTLGTIALSMWLCRKSPSPKNSSNADLLSEDDSSASEPSPTQGFIQ